MLSVINEFLLLRKNIKGFNCVFAGDIPMGSGMSSSAEIKKMGRKAFVHQADTADEAQVGKMVDAAVKAKEMAAQTIL